MAASDCLVLPREERKIAICVLSRPNYRPPVYLERSAPAGHFFQRRKSSRDPGQLSPFGLHVEKPEPSIYS